MFQQLVVPVDGSAASWAVVSMAARLASDVDGSVQVVSVVDRLADVVGARRELVDGLEQLGELPVAPTPDILASDDVAGALGRHVEAIDGAMIMMSSHGHGRSAAVLGSVADELLRLTFGPIIVVGHAAPVDAGRLEGPYVVPIDGSKTSESITSIVGAWAVEFDAMSWIVAVIEPDVNPGGDSSESGYPARIARGMAGQTHRRVEFEVLHRDHPAAAIVEFAVQVDAGMLFVATHGRTGMSRLRLGSVAADLVRRAPCPIVLFRPPDLSE